MFQIWPYTIAIFGGVSELPGPVWKCKNLSQMNTEQISPILQNLKGIFCLGFCAHSHVLLTDCHQRGGMYRLRFAFHQ